MASDSMLLGQGAGGGCVPALCTSCSAACVEGQRDTATHSGTIRFPRSAGLGTQGSRAGLGWAVAHQAAMISTGSYLGRY